MSLIFQGVATSAVLMDTFGLPYLVFHVLQVPMLQMSHVCNLPVQWPLFFGGVTIVLSWLMTYLIEM